MTADCFACKSGRFLTPERWRIQAGCSAHKSGFSTRGCRQRYGFWEASRSRCRMDGICATARRCSLPIRRNESWLGSAPPVRPPRLLDFTGLGSRWFGHPPLRRDMKSSFIARRLLAAMILVAGSLGGMRTNSGRTQGDSGWGFSEANLDRSCKPCDDFNQFAMGGWMKNNPIPAEYPNWGSFTMLADRNQTVLRTILEDAAKSDAAAGSNQQKIGDFYSSCMDTTAIEAAGVKPLAAEFATI